jgi:ubiquinone/menaquinone biosynthesis C-methylase UbiE
MGERSGTLMDCNAIARFYQPVEYLCFGRGLERRRFAYLTEAVSSRRAIVCGGGDGRFLARLLHCNPEVEIDFVDLSSRMVELAEARVMGMGTLARSRVNFHVGDIREFKPHRGYYDLIVTNFFLDCFLDREIQAVVSLLSHWAAPEAQWMVSEFREGDGRINRLWTRWTIRGLYGAFRITTGLRPTRLPQFSAALHDAGFRSLYTQDACGGLLQSSLWVRKAAHHPSTATA